MAVRNSLSRSPLYLITLSQLCGVFTYPYGAPPTACEGMSPDHGFQPQTVESPFQIRPSAMVYCPKNEINVTLSGDVPFRGFICQSRPSVNGFDTSGSLTSSASDAERITNNCANKASLTQKDSRKKPSVSFTWTPDISKTVMIYITCTIVEKKDTYWVQQYIPIKYAGLNKCTPEGGARGLPNSCSDSSTCDMQFTSSVCDTTADADGECICPSNMTVAHPTHTFCSPIGLPTRCDDSTACDMYFRSSICDADADADGQCVCPSNMKVANPSDNFCTTKTYNDTCNMNSDCAGATNAVCTNGLCQVDDDVCTMNSDCADLTDTVCIEGRCQISGADRTAFSLISLIVCGLLFYFINT